MTVVGVRKQDLVPVFLNLLKTSREKLSLRTPTGEDAPPELYQGFHEMFQAVERLFRGEYDELTCREFRERFFAGAVNAEKK